MGLRKWLGAVLGRAEAEPSPGEVQPSGPAVPSRRDAEIEALLQPLQQSAVANLASALLDDPERRQKLAELSANDPAAAIDVLRRFEARDPDVRFVLELARLYASRREDAPAQAAFERLEREPGFAAEAHEQLGLIAERRGDEALARVHFQRALAHDWERHTALEAFRRLAPPASSVAAPLSIVLHEPPPGFVLRHPLGRGGSGTVYLAQDEVLGRPVAIKFLHPHLRRRSERVAELQAEARLVAGLGGRDVVTVYDLDPTRHLIIMEYMSAGTLADRLASHRPLAPATALACAAKVAATLARAHEAGVVHRDIKPANIFFRPQGEAVVGDWGVAALEEHTDLAVAGTRRYAAPEAVAGAQVDRRVDVYAVGAMLAEMLTGEQPPLSRAAWEPWLSRAAAVFGDDAARALAWLRRSVACSVDERLPEADELAAGALAWQLRLAGESGAAEALELLML